ncbi:MAG: hypothetical protein PHE43_03900 [Candidatus Nanoarchaeia archaeon]|nr:hypothetical protein [Candidatus Nanoarchaeia archaeon]
MGDPILDKLKNRYRSIPINPVREVQTDYADLGSIVQRQIPEEESFPFIDEEGDLRINYHHRHRNLNTFSHRLSERIKDDFRYNKNPQKVKDEWKKAALAATGICFIIEPVSTLIASSLGYFGIKSYQTLRRKR